MGFLSGPKIPKPPPPPNAAVVPVPPDQERSSTGLAPAASSLISTSAQGLKRRASTQRTSLIGGG